MDTPKFHHLRPITDLAEVKRARRATPIRPYDDAAIFTQDNTQDDTWVSDLAAAIKENEKPDGGVAYDRAGAAPMVSGLVMPGPKAQNGVGFLACV